MVDDLQDLYSALGKFSVFDTSHMTELDRRFVIHCMDLMDKVNKQIQLWKTKNVIKEMVD